MKLFTYKRIKDIFGRDRFEIKPQENITDIVIRKITVPYNSTVKEIKSKIVEMWNVPYQEIELKESEAFEYDR